LNFICTGLSSGKTEIKTWKISWLNILLQIKPEGLVENIKLFYNDIIALVGKEGTEVVKSVERFLAQLRTEFTSSNFIHSKQFCIDLMKTLTQIFGTEPNRRRTLEIFKWVHVILEVQLHSIGENESQEEAEEDIRQFKNIISEILLFILSCLKEEDEDIKTEALKVNALLQTRIIDILKRDNKEESTDKDSFFPQIFTYLKQMISRNSNTKTIYHALKWIENLVDYFPQELNQLKAEIIDNLEHPDIEIVETSVILIAKYLNKIEDYSLLGEILTFMENASISTLDQSK